MTRMKLVAGGLAGGLLAWLIAPQLFGEFPSVRHKVIRAALLVSGEQLRVPVPAEPALEHLHPPFAAISRVRNDATLPLAIRIAVDDREICSAQIPPGVSQRLDCAVPGPWAGRENHTVVFSANSPGYTVEYLELATHFGALSPGPRNLIVVPKGFSGFRAPAVWHVIAIFVLLALSVWSVRNPRLRTAVSIAHLALTTIVGCVVAVVILSDAVSPYSLLISSTFLERLLLLTALPRLWAVASALAARLNRTRASRLTGPIGAGLVVGGLFVALAAHQVIERHRGNTSGLLLVSHYFFDKSPMSDDDDIGQTLAFSDGNGYDGQFFYYMAFDPFLTRFRGEPQRYREFIDAPPYRYGRIGFSVLTKVLAGDRPSRYPITMVALVIGALALCGALLGAIAQHHGLSAWYGALIVLVPGFWQSAGATLPEPLAVAFFLAAYLCLVRQKWWACGLLLALSMLVRETGGALVLALAAGLVLNGKRREAAIITLLAFVPIVLWKCFVGWVFWADYGMAGVMPHPNDVGVPFGGVWELWTTIGRGEYFTGSPEMIRAGLTFPILTTAGAVLALIAAVKRPSPMAAAALFYAVLTITFNYEAVWLDVGNAQRLTIDLFVALALVFLQLPRDQRPLPRTFTVFWWATAWYVFFGTFDAASVRQMLTGF